MAHEMTANDTAVYHKTRAWHGLGTVVERSMSVMDAYDKSGLGWEVTKSEGITVDGSWTDEYRGIVREDTSEVLGIVSTRYKPVQNHEVFDLAQYFSSVATVESAGSIMGGRRNYLLLHSDSFEATSKDMMEKYMCLMWGHDGKLSLTVKPTSIRVVCKNTMDMVLNKKATGLSIRHSGDLETKMAEARRIITQYKKTGTLFEIEVKALANATISHDGLRKFFFNAYEKFYEKIPTSPTTEAEGVAHEKACHTLLNWENTFEEETNEILPSPWVAVNAITNFVQHRVGSRGRKATPDAHAFNNLSGANAKLSRDVMKFALETI